MGFSRGDELLKLSYWHLHFSVGIFMAYGLFPKDKGIACLQHGVSNVLASSHHILEIENKL